VASTRSHNDDGFDADWIDYVFTAWAGCENSKCKEEFAISGRGGVAPEYVSGGDGDGEWDYFDYFDPLLIQPPLELFPIPTKWPAQVAKELRAAFALYWMNGAACAGRVRVALEHLMNHLGIPKRKKNPKGGMYDLSLHTRIEAFATKEPALGKQLMALKWLGNTGSHDQNVTKEDLLDGFEILEHTLREILDKPSAAVAALAKKLTKKHKK
jgi:hypothetical protein